MKIRHILLIFCVIVSACAIPFESVLTLSEETLEYDSDENFDGGSPQIWALLVAGSDGWGNYRHQADICHAYQILHRHGVPDERIIVMMYDDIANNTNNPYPGKIYNRPNGTDEYKNVLKDYTGEDVTPEKFLNILTGNKKAMSGIGSGKVIQSTAQDNVFVYFTDHGAPGLVAFPDGELYAKPLHRALHKMYEEHRYKQLTFYMEACESGSMFKDILSSHIKVYAMTAANGRESSWGTYCENPMHLPCMGDLFSVVWMQDSDRENIQVETLQHQFDVTKRLTNKSHVQKFGDLGILRDKVADFQGQKTAPFRLTDDAAPLTFKKHDHVPSREIPLHYATKRVQWAVTHAERRQRLRELMRMEQRRLIVDRTVKAIVDHLVFNEDKRERMLGDHPRDLAAVMDCHERATRAFSRHCFKLSKNPYALKYVKVMGNLCEHGFHQRRIVGGIKHVCSRILPALSTQTLCGIE